MSFKAGAITGTIGLDNKPAVKAIHEVGTEAKGMKGSIEDAAKGAKSYKETLHEIKDQLGKRSAFGESMELLRGGGVIMGLNIAADAFKSVGDSTAKFVDEMRKGDLSGSEMAEEFVRTVPIVGKIYEGLEGWAEAITGTKYEMAAATEQLKKFDETLEFQKQTKREIIQMNKEEAASLRGIGKEMALIGKVGIDRTLQENENHYRDVVAAATGKSGKNALTEKEREQYEAAEKLLANPRQPDKPTEAEFAHAGRNWPVQYPEATEKVHKYTDWLNSMNGAKAIADAAEAKMHAGDVNAGKEDKLAKQYATVKGLADLWGDVVQKWNEGAAAFNRIDDAIQGAKRGLRQFGMTDTEAAIDNFTRLKGVTDKQIQTFSDLEKQRALAENAKSAATPREKFDSDISDLGRKVLAGEMYPQTAARLSARAEMDYLGGREAQFRGERAPDVPVLSGDRHFPSVSTNNNGPNPQMDRELKAAEATVSKLDELIGITKGQRTQAVQTVTIGN